VWVNTAQLRRVSPWTAVFALLTECEYYIRGDTTHLFYGHNDPFSRGVYGGSEREVDKVAIRWIRDNELMIPSMLRDNACGRLSHPARAACAAAAISDSIVTGQLGEGEFEQRAARASYIRKCFASNDEACTPSDPPNHSVKEESSAMQVPDRTQLRSDSAIMEAQSRLLNYVESDELAYTQGKHRLGLEDYSTSKYSSAQLIYVQQQSARVAEQFGFLNSTLEKLKQDCERNGFSGIAAFVQSRIQVVQSYTQGQNKKAIAARVKQVDSVFAKMHDLSQNLSVNVTIESTPSDGAHFIMRTKSGGIEIDTLTYSHLKNAYRGLYDYDVTADGLLSGNGVINLVDSPVNSTITCHLSDDHSSFCAFQ
jgi:hypothetical protein